MKKYAILSALCLAGACCSASWYWPFGGDDDEPPRLSELMAPATDLIDEASDLTEEGKVDEAISKYQEALVVLGRIEAENPDRADKPEFASLRNKRAYVTAAIDSLQLEQARLNVRPVAITDTRALEEKFRKQKESERSAAEKPVPTAAEAESGAAVKEVESALARSGKAAEVAPGEKEKKASSEAASAGAEAKAAAESEVAAAKEALAANPEDRRARLRLALADLGAGDFEGALLAVKELLAMRPNDAAALNLRARIESEKGDMAAAERTLDQCIRSNPRNPYAYYNMARLLVAVRGKSGAASAKRYYENSLLFGGEKDEAFEKALGELQ